MRCFARCLCLVAWLSLGPALASAEPAANDRAVARWLDREAAGFLQIYRDLHQNPELSLQEKRTASIVARELGRAGYRVEAGFGGHGVVAVLKNGAGPTVLVRGDMDALPIAEETGLPYASKVQAKDETGHRVPVMHACGHDMHVTNLLAAATYLAQQRATWSGTLLVIAQPAEELGEGARRMIDAGLFTRFGKPSHAIAFHVDPSVRAGHVALASGWAAANADAVDVTLYGRGGHGSRPQDAIDPIVIGSQYVLALQTLISRRNDPQAPAVITVGTFRAGTKRNVIPDSAELLLTVRSYSDEVRKQLLDGIAQLARDLCVAFGCPKPPAISIKEHYTPAVYNDPAFAAQATRVFASVLGEAAVGPAERAMTAEDFGRFGRHLQIPSLLIRLGATSEADYVASRKPGAAPLPTLHSSRFAPDAPVTLRTGVRATVALVTSLMPPSK